MSANSSIEWTESTWNPMTGCTKVSLGCKHCYAERIARRLHAMGQPNYRNGFQVTLHEHVLKYPLTWKKRRVIFVNSMSDLFHEDIPFEFVKIVFNVMVRAHRHCFQILTKRSQRLLELSPDLPWRNNIWMGVTVENQDYVYRIDDLRKTDARIKFLSFEPLLGSINDINLENIDWVIVGGESGPGCRPMRKEWATDIRDQCLKANVPFFFKQWGGVNRKKRGRELEGEFWNEIPPVFRESITS